jgi:ribose-phosphate pyrophosphokinase
MILVNGQEVKFETFPNGETRLVADSLNDGWIIKRLSFKYENDSDLIKLMLLKNYLDAIRKNVIEFVIYYMPYSRMDRSENGSPFTLKYIANFINSLNFLNVTVIEPHSDVTTALLNNVKARYINFELLPLVMKEIGFDKESDFIVFPDTTSNKRYGKVKIPNQLTGIKHRNFETGKIESLELAGEVNNEGFKALLIDDLCSYGGTFLLTAEKLRELGASEIYLLVGHCEDSIFKGSIFQSDLINKVFTTNTILTKQDYWSNAKYKDRLKVYDIEWLLSEN